MSLQELTQSIQLGLKELVFDAVNEGVHHLLMKNTTLDFLYVLLAEVAIVAHINQMLHPVKPAENITEAAELVSSSTHLINIHSFINDFETIPILYPHVINVGNTNVAEGDYLDFNELSLSVPLSVVLNGGDWTEGEKQEGRSNGYGQFFNDILWGDQYREWEETIEYYMEGQHEFHLFMDRSVEELVSAMLKIRIYNGNPIESDKIAHEISQIQFSGRPENADQQILAAVQKLYTNLMQDRDFDVSYQVYNPLLLSLFDDVNANKGTLQHILKHYAWPDDIFFTDSYYIARIVHLHKHDIKALPLELRQLITKYKIQYKRDEPEYAQHSAPEDADRRAVDLYTQFNPRGLGSETGLGDIYDPSHNDCEIRPMPIEILASKVNATIESSPILRAQLDFIKHSDHTVVKRLREKFKKGPLYNFLFKDADPEPVTLSEKDVMQAFDNVIFIRKDGSLSFSGRIVDDLNKVRFRDVVSAVKKEVTDLFNVQLDERGEAELKKMIRNPTNEIAVAAAENGRKTTKKSK